MAIAIPIPIPTAEQKDLKPKINVLEINPYELPDLSYFCCLPGRAGGSPYAVSVHRLAGGFNPLAAQSGWKSVVESESASESESELAIGF